MTKNPKPKKKSVVASGSRVIAQLPKVKRRERYAEIAKFLARSKFLAKIEYRKPKTVVRCCQGNAEHVRNSAKAVYHPSLD